METVGTKAMDSEPMAICVIIDGKPVAVDGQKKTCMKLVKTNDLAGPSVEVTFGLSPVSSR